MRMMEKDDSEELSCLIDDIHKQRSTVGADAEMLELVRLAENLKISAGNHLPPDAMISATVAQLTAEPVKPSLFRRWKVTALTGAAAALFLAAAYIGGSLSREETPQIAQNTPVPIGEKPTQLQPPMTVVPLPVPDNKELADGAGQTNKNSRDVPLNKVVREERSSQHAMTPHVDEPQASVPVEASKAVVRAELSQVADVPSPAEKGKQPVAELITLKGQKADRIIVEETLVRQIFNLGQSDEIIVSYYQMSAPAVKMSKNLPDSSGQQKHLAAVNQIKTVVGGREITVSGRQTAEELRVIASQLAEAGAGGQ